MSNMTPRTSMLPQMDMNLILGNVSPPSIPSLPYAKGFIGHSIHGWKVKKQAEYHKFEADIAASQTSMVKSRLEAMMSMVTFADKVKLEFRTMEHNTTLMNMKEFEYQCEIRKKQAEAEEAEFSARTAELDLKARTITMKQEFGDDF